MKIEFSKEDAEKILYDSFCNGGLTELCFSDVFICLDKEPNLTNYKNSKDRLKERNTHTICREDVLIEILKNGQEIVFIDENDDLMVKLTLQSSLNNFNELCNEDKIRLSHLLDDDNYNVDAWNYYEALQYALYKKVLYC
jgi:N12 class adenine-specific DNA methylase